MTTVYSQLSSSAKVWTPYSLHTTHKPLSHKAPKWCPHQGYTVGIDNAPPFPNNNLYFHKNTISMPDTSPINKDKITHVPYNIIYNHPFTTTTSLEKRWGSNIVGQFVLIRTKRLQTNVDNTLLCNLPTNDITGHSFYDMSANGGYHNKKTHPVALDFGDSSMSITDDTDVNFRHEWLFGYVSSYNSYTGKHELVFKFDNIYFKGFWVDLNQCVFQEWSSHDMQWYMNDIYSKNTEYPPSLHLFSTHETSLIEPCAALTIQRVWRGYYSRTYWDLPDLIHIV